MSKKRKLSVLLLTFLLIASIGFSAFVYTQDWPMFGHDKELTGYSSSDGPTVGTLQWEYTTGGAVTSPVVADGKVYIGSNDGKVYCLDADTGTAIWEYIVSGKPSIHSPAVVYNKVYISSTSGYIGCLNADTGTTIWEREGIFTLLTTSPAVRARSERSTNIAIGKENGVATLNADYMIHPPTITWDSIELVPQAPVTSTPTFTNLGVVIGSENWRIYSRGVDEWEYATNGPVTSAAVVDGKVYFGSGDFKVYCLDAISGDLIWEYSTDGPVSSSPAVADGEVYIGSNGWVYCLNAYTGDMIWDYRTEGAVISSPAVTDKEVYIGSEDGKVYCLNADTGAKIWDYTIGSPVTSSPAVADGKVYISSNDGNVYCLGSTLDERIALLEAENTETKIDFGLLPGTRINVYSQGEFKITIDETTHVWHGFRSSFDDPWSTYTEERKTEFLSTAQWRFTVDGVEVPLDHVYRYDVENDVMWSLYYRVFPPGYFKIGSHRLGGEWHYMEDGVWDSIVREAKLQVK